MEYCQWSIKCKLCRNDIIYNTEVLKSNFCDFKNAYFLVRRNITIAGAIVARVAFKSCAPCTMYITKIDGTTIDDAEVLDLVMPTYNLLFLNYYSQIVNSYTQIILKRQVVDGFVPKMKQIILTVILWALMLLNFPNIRLN